MSRFLYHLRRFLSRLFGHSVRHGLAFLDLPSPGFVGRPLSLCPLVQVPDDGHTLTLFHALLLLVLGNLGLLNNRPIDHEGGPVRLFVSGGGGEGEGEKLETI